MGIVMTLQVRCTDEDIKILDRRAGEMGLDRSSFVRMLIRKGEVRSDIVRTEEDTEEVSSKEVSSDIDVGSFEDWVEESGIGGVLRITKPDDELEYNELNGYRRAELKGRLVKLRSKEGVSRGDVFSLAEEYGVK